jgi:hypothetical protein
MNEGPLPQMGMGGAVSTVRSPSTPLNFATVFTRISVKGYAERLVIQPSRAGTAEIEREKERGSAEKQYDQSPFSTFDPDEFHSEFTRPSSTERH